MRWLSDELKKSFGQKVLKLSLSSGCTCPNRDGTIGSGGCAFCSAGGSGEFAAPFMPADRHAAETVSVRIDRQIEDAKRRVDQKFPKNMPVSERKYIAYFQSFTNTYGDTARLKELFTETIRRPEVVILAVGTRPDCLEPDKIAMLAELNRVKPVWVELGLQTIHETTARAMNRGYELPVFEDAYRRLKDAGLTVVVHVILGLPGETREMMLETAEFVGEMFRESAAAAKPSDDRIREVSEFEREGLPDPAARPEAPGDGVKIQMLQILKDTALGEQYLREPFPLMTKDEYVSVAAECLRRLPPETVIHRATGDPPKNLLIAPKWCADKKRVMNDLRKELNTVVIKQKSDT